MQFGVFSVSDITRDPVSGETPTEAERIKAVVEIAVKASVLPEWVFLAVSPFSHLSSYFQPTLADYVVLTLLAAGLLAWYLSVIAGFGFSSTGLCRDNAHLHHQRREYSSLQRPGSYLRRDAHLSFDRPRYLQY